MLVLSRRANETIAFPDLGITIKVVRVKGKSVSIGIEAPDQVQILRGELVESAKSFDAPQMMISQTIHSRPMNLLGLVNS